MSPLSKDETGHGSSYFTCTSYGYPIRNAAMTTDQKTLLQRPKPADQSSTQRPQTTKELKQVTVTVALRAA